MDGGPLLARPRGTRERRGELIGSAFAAAIGGALFGPVLGGIASLVGTAAAFGGVAVLAGAIAVFAALTPAPAPGEWQPLSDLFRAFRDRRVLTAGWFVVLPGLLFGTLSVLGPLRLSELGFGGVAIGATWLVAAGLEAIVSPVTGRISDRRGRGGPLRAALLASAAAAALLPWPDRKLVLAVVIVAAAVSFGIFWTPAMSMLADAAEARRLDYGFAFALDEHGLGARPARRRGARRRDRRPRGGRGALPLPGRDLPRLVRAPRPAPARAGLEPA